MAEKRIIQTTIRFEDDFNVWLRGQLAKHHVLLNEAAVEGLKLYFAEGRPARKAAPSPKERDEFDRFVESARPEVLKAVRALMAAEVNR